MMPPFTLSISIYWDRELLLVILYYSPIGNGATVRVEVDANLHYW